MAAAADVEIPTNYVEIPTVQLQRVWLETESQVVWATDHGHWWSLRIADGPAADWKPWSGPWIVDVPVVKQVQVPQIQEVVRTVEVPQILKKKKKTKKKKNKKLHT
jgi:hypothetical protein